MASPVVEEPPAAQDVPAIDLQDGESATPSSVAAPGAAWVCDVEKNRRSGCTHQRGNCGFTGGRNWWQRSRHWSQDLTEAPALSSSFT